jgi:hypothetical protein
MPYDDDEDDDDDGGTYRHKVPLSVLYSWVISAIGVDADIFPPINLPDDDDEKCFMCAFDFKILRVEPFFIGIQ